MFIADESLFLKGMSNDTDAWASYAEHVSDKFMREPEAFGFNTVRTEQKHLAKRCSRL